MQFNPKLYNFIDAAALGEETKTLGHVWLKLDDQVVDEYRFVLLKVVRLSSMSEFLSVMRQRDDMTWEVTGECNYFHAGMHYSFPKREWLETSLAILDEYLESEKVFK